MADDSNTTNPPGDKPAFTPGPWTAKNSNHDDLANRVRFDGPVVVYADEDCDIHPIADCSCNHSCRITDETFANAHLIAAAPDIYEALERLCEILESEEGGDVAPCIGSDNPNEHAVGLARKALSLARGDSQ
jgi:hypothetical protein